MIDYTGMEVDEAMEALAPGSRIDKIMDEINGKLRTAEWTIKLNTLIEINDLYLKNKKNFSANLRDKIEYAFYMLNRTDYNKIESIVIATDKNGIRRR